MDLKKLINEKVTHTTLGNGHIVNITKNNVSVKFSKGEVQFFSFPNTFKNNIIRFIDIDHDKVLEEIYLMEKEEKILKEVKPQVKIETKKVEEVKEVVKEVFKEEPKIEVKEEKVLTPKFEPRVTTPTKERATEVFFASSPTSSLNIKEDLEVVLFDNFYHSDTNLEKDDYETFLREFNEYWENKRLLSYLVIKYVNNKVVYDNLKEKSISIILNTMVNEPSSFDRGFVTVFIAMLAHKEYDGTLWLYIEQELEELYLKEDQQLINRAIRKLITDNAFGGEVSVLIHAGVFVKYYKDYFTFMYDIYKANLGLALENKPVVGILTDTFTGLKDDLLKEDSDVLYLKLTDTTYYLAKYSKQAMIIDPKEMAKVFKHFLVHIDLWYHGNKYDKTERDLHRALRLWLDIESSKITKIIADKTPVINAPTYKFKNSTMGVYLSFPPINITNITNIDYKRLDVQLTEGKTKTTLTIDLDYKTYQRIGYYSVILDDYLIKNPFETLKLNVLYDKKLVFSCANNLTKELYIFNDYGEELLHTNNYFGHVYIVHDPKEKFNKAKEYSFGTHKISYLNIDNENSLTFSEEVIEPQKEVTLGLNGERVNSIKGKVNKKDYDIYRSVDSFVFESELKPKDMVLVINKQIRSLSELVNTDNKDNDLTLYIINLKEFTAISDIYSLEIKDLKNNIISKVSFIYDRNLNLHIKEKEEPLVAHYTLNSSFPVADKIKYNFDLKIEDEVKYIFKLNNKIVEYVALLDIPRFKYKKEDLWQPLKDMELISDTLYVTKDILSVEVLIGNDIILLDEKHNSATYTSYDVSSIKKDRFDYENVVKIIFNLHDKLHKEYNLYLEPTVIGKPKIDFTNDNNLILEFDIKCFKDDKWLLEITNPFKSKKRVDLTSKKAVIKDFIPFKKYILTIKDKENILYGAKMSSFYEESFIFTDTKALLGKTLKLNSASFINKDKNEDTTEILNVAVNFKRRVNEFDDLNLTTFNLNNTIYEIELYNVGRNDNLRSFGYKEMLYAEIVSERSDSFLKLKIEDELGNPLVIDSKNLSLKNKFRKKDTPLIYLYSNVLVDMLK